MKRNKLQSPLLRYTKPRGRDKQENNDFTIFLKILSQKYVLHIKEVQKKQCLNVSGGGARSESMRTKEVTHSEAEF